VRPASGAVRGESGRSVQIFHDLQVEGTGERAVGNAAAAQRGLVHLQQLRAAGFGRSRASRLVKRGTLYPLLPRVFAVGRPALEPLALELAVVLWLGRDAVLSHRSAAAIWGLVPAPDGQVDVTIVGRDARPHDGITTYRVDEINGRDVRIRDDLPVTAPARTVIDLASRCADGVFDRAMAEAQVLRLLTEREIEQALSRAPTRSGSARIRAALRETGPGMTRSEGERRTLRLLERARLPRPETNVPLLGYEVDFLWRAQRLVLEVDGYRFHGHRAAFERDREKDQTLTAAGYRVIRVTWRQVEREPFVIVARIAQALNAPESVP
jgi:very-short-patch-repair endonuclease